MLTNSPIESSPLIVNNSELQLDIGEFIGTVVDDRSKWLLISNPWKPPPGYQFPYSTHNKNEKLEKRYLKHSHLDAFKWLVYSEKSKRVFCKYCSLFSTVRGRHGQASGPVKLVKEPLTNFAKLFGKDGSLETHQIGEYHKQAVSAAENFMLAYTRPQNSVVNQIASHRMEQIARNHQRLKPIIETVIFLGRQNIPFRGHRDDGKLLNEASTTSSIVNEGNFRELLRYRVQSGDKVLEQHLKDSNANATYISKNTQNQLIECCGELILEKILTKI